MSDSENDDGRKSGKAAKKKAGPSKEGIKPSEHGKRAKKTKSSDIPKEITGKTPEEIAEDQESKRLFKVAHQIGLLAKRREGTKSLLRPSSIIRKYTQSKPVEIVKKAVSRKNKALLLFPGLVAVLKEGKIGQLSNMHKNPILDIEFPAGTLKLKGTRINSKQKYISIQPKGKKFVLQDVFDQLVVFTELEWTGPAGEHPSLRNTQDTLLHSKFEFEGGAAESAHGGADAGGSNQSRLGKGEDGTLRCRPPSMSQEVADALADGPEGRVRRQSTAVAKVRYRERDSDDEGSDHSDSSEDDAAAEAEESGTRSPVRALPSAPFEVFGIVRRPGIAAERRRSEAAPAAAADGDDNEAKAPAERKRPDKPKPSTAPAPAGGGKGAPGAAGQQSIMSFVRPAAAKPSGGVISLDSDDDPPAAGARPARPRPAGAKSYREGGSDDEGSDSGGGSAGTGSDSDRPRKKGGAAKKPAAARASPGKKAPAGRPAKSPAAAKPRKRKGGADSDSDDADSDGAPRKKPAAKKAAPSAKAKPASAGKRKRKADSDDDDEESDEEEDDDDSDGGAPRRKPAAKSAGKAKPSAAAKRKSKAGSDDDSDGGTPRRKPAAKKPASAAKRKSKDDSDDDGSASDVGPARRTSGSKKATPGKAKPAGKVSGKSAGKPKKKRKDSDDEDESEPTSDDDDDDDWAA